METCNSLSSTLILENHETMSMPLPFNEAGYEPLLKEAELKGRDKLKCTESNLVTKNPLSEVKEPQN